MEYGDNPDPESGGGVAEEQAGLTLVGVRGGGSSWGMFRGFVQVRKAFDPTDLDNMASDVNLLCNRLEEAVALLTQVREYHWSTWLREDLDRIRDGNIEGLSHLRRAFGGMGSFNDLIISTVNGHQIDPRDYETVNVKLDELRSSIFELVQLVRQRVEAELAAAPFRGSDTGSS